MTKPHAQAKSGSARTAQSAIQKDILPLEQMMAPDETNVQAQPSTEQDNNGTISPAPELRFEGFFEPWHKRQLMDVAQIIGGGTPSTSIKAYWDGSINWFTPAELGDHIFVYHSERKITQQGIEHSTAKLLPQGTILYYSRGAGLGKTAILATPSTTNQGFQSIVPSPKELDSYFIFSCSNQLKAYGVSVGGGSTFKEVSGKQMEVMPLLIPSLPEQQRIGTLFKELDRNLSLNRAQLEKLTQLKTSMLEQMRPQSDKHNNNLKFSNLGNNSCFKQVTLGEITVFGSDIGKSDHYVSTENMLPDFQGVNFESYNKTDFSGILFNKNNILVSNIRPYLKKIWLANISGCCSHDVLVLKVKDPKIVSPTYLFQNLASSWFIDYVMQNVKGSKMPRGDKTHIMNTPIILPRAPAS